MINIMYQLICDMQLVVSQKSADNDDSLNELTDLYDGYFFMKQKEAEFFLS